MIFPLPNMGHRQVPWRVQGYHLGIFITTSRSYQTSDHRSLGCCRSPDTLEFGGSGVHSLTKTIPPKKSRNRRKTPGTWDNNMCFCLKKTFFLPLPSMWVQKPNVVPIYGVWMANVGKCRIATRIRHGYMRHPQFLGQIKRSIHIP